MNEKSQCEKKSEVKNKEENVKVSYRKGEKDEGGSKEDLKER